MRTRTASVVAAAAPLIVLAGCSASTSGTASSTAPAASPSDAAASPSGSASGSRQAWVRGTNATLTNATPSAVEVKPYTYSGGEGSYASLAAGASTSATSTWESAGATRVIYFVKRPSGGVVALTLYNPTAGNPSTHVCESSSPTGCAAEKVADYTGYLPYDEGETQTTSTEDGAATFTVTRNADDDDNKNWTVSLDSLS